MRPEPVELADWEYNRAGPSEKNVPPVVEPAFERTKYLQAFEPMVGHTWESTIDGKLVGASAGPMRIESTIEWLPQSEAFYLRVVWPQNDDVAIDDVADDADVREPLHLFDVNVYHHPGTKNLRCLALSANGGVHECEVVVLDDGSFEFKLVSYEAGQSIERVVQVDLQSKSSIRARIWTLQDAQRTLTAEILSQLTNQDPSQENANP